MNAVLKCFIRNGRVEVDEPVDWPDGTEVVVAPAATGREDGPVPLDEIARTLATMRRLPPLDIPDAVAAGLDAWRRKSNRHGMDRGESGIEDVFR